MNKSTMEYLIEDVGATVLRNGHIDEQQELIIYQILESINNDDLSLNVSYHAPVLIFICEHLKCDNVHLNNIIEDVKHQYMQFLVDSHASDRRSDTIPLANLHFLQILNNKEDLTNG